MKKITLLLSLLCLALMGYAEDQAPIEASFTGGELTLTYTKGSDSNWINNNLSSWLSTNCNYQMSEVDKITLKGDWDNSHLMAIGEKIVAKYGNEQDPVYLDISSCKKFYCKFKGVPEGFDVINHEVGGQDYTPDNNGFNIEKQKPGECAEFSLDKIKESNKLSGITFPKNSPDFDCIPNRALQSCSSLKTVVISEGIKAIGNEAFQGCSNLADVTFPGTLEEMDGEAFSRSGIREAKLANTKIKRIRHETFAYCSNLTGEVTVPKELVQIQRQAFMQSGIKAIDLSKCHDLTLIAQASFALCPNLKTVRICSHPKIITGGNGAFKETTHLETVEVVGCPNTTLSECVCEYHAFAYDITAVQTDEHKVDQSCKLIYPHDMALDQIQKSASSPYSSAFDFFVGNYKIGTVIDHENLLYYYRDIPEKGDDASPQGDRKPVENADKYLNNGWLEFINVGESVPVLPDPKGKFLRTYSRDKDSGPVLLKRTGDDAIRAYRVLDFKYKWTTKDENDNITDFLGYLVLEELTTTINGVTYSYVPEETGVVLYSKKSDESGMLVLPPYENWIEMQKNNTLDNVFPKFKHTDSYYDKEKGIGNPNANMLKGTYEEEAYVAPTDPWTPSDNANGGYYTNPKTHRNFTLAKANDYTDENPKYQWRRLKASHMRTNRAYAHLPVDRFPFSNESTAQFPEFEETANGLNQDDNGGSNQAPLGMIFDGEETTEIIAIDTKGIVVDNDAWYTLQGVRVAVPTKGVYIHNNKKVVIK